LTAGAARPSVATGPNAFEITNDRVFGPGGEALARRFARRVLAFDEVHSLAFDPDRATATLARGAAGLRTSAAHARREGVELGDVGPGQRTDQRTHRGAPSGQN